MGSPLRDGARIDLPTALFAAAVGLLALGTVGATAFPAAWLERGHMRYGFVVFALTQPIPFMYTGENRFERTSGVDPGADAAERCEHERAGLRQHVPVAVLTAPSHRWLQARCGLPAEVVLESSMRGHQTRSTWVVSERDGVVRVEPGR